VKILWLKYGKKDNVEGRSHGSISIIATVFEWNSRGKARKSSIMVGNAPFEMAGRHIRLEIIYSGELC
jgi:hypothetical protein